MKILYITTDWNTPHRIKTGEYGGIGYYRAHGPAKALRAKGHQVDVLGKDLENHIDVNNVIGSYMEFIAPYDLVVIKQSDTANVAQLIGACKETKTPIAMDLDDLITEVDKDNPAYKTGYEEGGAKQAFAVASLSMVDALFVSTQPLADEYEKFLRIKLQTKLPTYVLPNCCNTSLWSKQKPHETDAMVLGWQGSITHDNDLKIMLPAIKNLMEKYPNLFLSLTGGVTQEAYNNVLGKVFGDKLIERVAVNQGTPSFKNFPEYMKRHQWDIGVIPLRDSKFSRAKSHIKWLENSLLGVPTIASNVYPYTEPVRGTDIIVDGETGILCEDDEWEKKLEMLILDEKKRKYLARDARNFVMENWTYSKHIDKWVDAFASVIKEGSKSLR